MTTNRWRIVLLMLIILTAALGIASRKFSGFLPAFLAKYSGDALYAVCVFWVLRFVFIKTSLNKIAIATFLFCASIEGLQLYQAPWIVSLRNTPPFGLLLGYGFLWSDMVCYVVGTVIAWLLGWAMEKL